MVERNYAGIQGDLKKQKRNWKSGRYFNVCCLVTHRKIHFLYGFIPIQKMISVFVFQVMVQPHNRHMSFSVYISALSISDTISLLNSKFLTNLESIKYFIMLSKQ